MKKKKNNNTKKKLLSSYHDPSQPGSLGGIQRFAKAKKLSVKNAREILERDLGYTLHKPRRRHFPTLPVVVYGIDDQWIGDLAEIQPLAKYNKGNRYLLMVIDAFSKYAWVQPLKNKTGKTVTEAFSKILKLAKGRKPLRFQTDDGKEFYNRTFTALMKEKNIHHFSTKGDTKASIVERFIRTFKERMFRYFTVANTLSYLPVLQSLVKGYNVSYHRSIGMAPQNVNVSNEEKVWHRLYGKRLRKPRKQRVEFKVNDRVRLNKKHRPFKKGYLPGWTEEVFVVREVRSGPVHTFKIEELDGTPIEGTFYKQDLQRVTVSDDDLFRIEKILKRKGNKVLVQWKGYGEKHNSWIDKSALQSRLN